MNFLQRFKNSFTCLYGIIEIVHGDLLIQVNETIIRFKLSDFGFDPNKEILPGSNYLLSDEFFSSANKALQDNLNFHKSIAPPLKLLIFLKSQLVNEICIRHYLDVAEMIGSNFTIIIDEKYRDNYPAHQIKNNWTELLRKALAYRKYGKTRMMI